MNEQNHEQKLPQEDVKVDGRKSRVKRTVKSAPRRIGWSGGLAHNEIGIRGSTLIAWLLSEANSQGLQLREMSEKIGITYGYFHQLRTGIKPVPGISEEVVDNCSIFLRVPRMAVMTAADIVRIDDLYAAKDFVPTYLRPALNFMRHDPNWGPFIHPLVFECDEKVQHLIVLLYEEATNRKLIPGKLTAERLMDAMVAKDIDPLQEKDYSKEEDTTTH